MATIALSKAKQTRIRALLKKHGHEAARVDGLKMSNTRELAESMAAVHGVTVETIGQALSKGTEG